MFFDRSLPLTSIILYLTTRMPGHLLPDVCAEIHPLLWRPEICGLTHHLCISNRAEIAQRSGTWKQRVYQSGITEERVQRGGVEIKEHVF